MSGTKPLSWEVTDHVENVWSLQEMSQASLKIHIKQTYILEDHMVISPLVCQQIVYLRTNPGVCLINIFVYYMKIPIWRVYVHIPLSDTYDIHLLEQCWKDRHPWHQTELPGFTISPRTKMSGKHRPPDMFRQPYLLYSAFLPGFW